eukprot:TRINITY_DN6655_c0_g1_i1.p1 TRINITY_DN6655_c0_g1~~TRINITY_DN6655_c0_g1_i1.p1  ORF type:complete len:287 (+),score=36.61 TRINITY_DN6655_c0_g1_i1:351-1211(+)
MSVSQMRKNNNCRLVLALLAWSSFFLGWTLTLTSEQYLETEIALQNTSTTLRIHRGLSFISLDSNHHGRAMNVVIEYSDKDSNGERLDPFCGSSAARSLFKTYFDVFSTDPDTDIIRQPSPGICCDNSTLFSDRRSNDEHHWCQLRDDVHFQRTVAMTLLTATLLVLLLSVACCRRWIHPRAAATAALILFAVGAIVHLSASIMALVWARKYIRHAPPLRGYSLNTADCMQYVLGAVLQLVCAILSAHLLCTSTQDAKVSTDESAAVTQPPVPLVQNQQPSERLQA